MLRLVAVRLQIVVRERDMCLSRQLMLSYDSDVFSADAVSSGKPCVNGQVDC